jgi:hypothetical protein
MREILKAALTLWYGVLMMAFIFLTATSFLSCIVGLAEERPDMLGAGIVGLIVFGCALRRYFGLFADRVDEVRRNSDRGGDDEW